MKKIMVTLLLVNSFMIVGQQNVKKSLSLKGTVDAYYQTYINGVNNKEQVFGTSFAKESGFALGMVNLIASYEGVKTGVVADVVFGPRGDEAVGGYNLNQLYVYWKVAENTKLTLGRFNTFLGYEVISPTINFNYSTSYLFSNGPFSHVGLKADVALSDDVSLMLAVMNPTDVNNNITDDYAFGAQLAYRGQFLNFYYDSGVALGYEIDYTGGFDLTDKFFLGVNGAYQSNDDEGFYGVALYPQLAASKSFSLGLRAEYFGLHGDDSDLPSVFSTTLTGSYVIENLIIKPELRLDSWSELSPYINRDGGSVSDLSSFAIAAVYTF